MKAVNLIPSDERRSGRAASGFATYVLLGALFIVVAVGAAYSLANRSISDRRHELADVQARAQTANDKAQALHAYTSFTALRQKRSETVRSLAGSRFDWSHALREVARTMPRDAWLTAMRATVTPSTAVEGGVVDPLRAAVSSPAIEIVGCTTSQDKVAGVMSSLRRGDGVQRVTLSSTEKLDAGAAGSSSSSGGDDCRNGNTHVPRFSMTIFFNAPAQSAVQATTTP
jgi:Tfp pilus assembly protein PilN